MIATCTLHWGWIRTRTCVWLARGSLECCKMHPGQKESDSKQPMTTCISWPPVVPVCRISVISRSNVLAMYGSVFWPVLVLAPTWGCHACPPSGNSGGSPDVRYPSLSVIRSLFSCLGGLCHVWWTSRSLVSNKLGNNSSMWCVFGCYGQLSSPSFLSTTLAQRNSLG